MKKKTFFSVLAVCFAAALFASLIVASAAKGAAEAETESRLARYMDLLEYDYAKADDIGTFVTEFAAAAGAHVSLVDADGIVVADSGEGAGEDLSGREEIVSALAEGEAFAEVFIGNTAYARYCRKLGDGEYLAVVSVPAPSFGRAWAQSVPEIFGLLVLCLCVGFCAERITSVFVLRPVEKLTRDVATGSREYRTDDPALRPLVKMLNEMNAEINSKVAKMKEDRRIEKLILASMEHGIVLFRSADDVILINNTAARLLDYEPNEPIRAFSEDREIAEILAAREASSVYRRIEERDYNLRFTFKEQSSVLLITDVTESMAAARSKNDFIANVTHEMNTPLTSIRGFAELIAEGGIPPARIGGVAKTIIKQSDRLSNLIRSIINFSAIDTDELPDYEVELTELIRETISSFEPKLAQKNLALRLDIADGVKVMSRRERLLEIFNNLVSNGIRYNKEGGTLTVTLTGGGHPVLSVADTGVGLSEEDKARIFDRFYTVDKSHNGGGGGFGLGLAIVKKLCKRAGWKLSVSSELGVGTEFKIEF